MASPSLYQPSPRFSHRAAQVGEKSYLWGGRTQNFSLSSRQTLASEIEIFDVFSETWKTKTATGAPPPGLYDGACTVVSETLYHFGGTDGHSLYNTLHCLDSLSLNWRELHGHAQNPADQPMPKIGCGLVTYTDTASIAVFAGYGLPRYPTQLGSRFVQDTKYTDGSGWTNEFHLFNLTNGQWTSPPTTGPRPPPCANFSFTAINHHMAVMFGGGQPEHGQVNDVYIIDFRSMEWTKLERPEGAPWPTERTLHAACCLNYGDDLPQLLVTGGVDEKGKTLSDAWLLDINTRRWREVTLPEGMHPRWGHTITAFNVCPGRTHTTTFGGSPKFEGHLGKSEDDHQKLAETTVMEFESIESQPSDDGSPSCEWVLVGVIGSNQMRSEARKAELEKIKQRKTEHAYQTWSGFPPGPTTVYPGIQFPPPLAADPNQGPWITPEFPTQRLAMHPPHLHQSTTHPVHKPTYQIHHPAQFTVPPTVPTLQPPYRSGGYREMHPEQLPPIPPIEPPPLPYHTQSVLPHTTVLLSTQSEFHPVVSSTAAYQVASTAAAPSLQPSTHSASLDTAVSATSPHTTYSGRPLQESPLPRWASHTADIKPKVKQPSPKEKKPFLSDVKPKMEMLPKKELEGFKIEPKEEVEEDVKLKQVFSVSDVEKSDLIEQLAAKNKHLLGMISQLKEQIAEKDDEMNERDNQIAEKDEKIAEKDENIEEMYKQIADKDHQIADKDQQMAKLAEQIAEKDQQILEQAKQIAVKDEQTMKYQRMYEGLMQETQVHRKQSSEQAALTHGGMRTDVITTEYLRGFETFAKTSFVIDSHSQTFEWQRYGLKLHIPEGAVPAEHTECRVHIKAGFTGQFNIPDDLQLVSCVYWLSCPQKFAKPVTLEIEHCASLQDSSQSSTVQFIVAKCSQAELPYQFRVLERGTFLPKSYYGSIQVSQFSFFGISIPKRSQPLQRYCCTHHYIQKDVNQWDVDFIITTGLQASLTVIQERYSDLDIISGPDFEVQFEEDTISLEIPGDGLQLNGWEIRPLVPPAITKQQVDTFNPGQQGQRVPYCRLQVKLKVKTLVELEYKVGLRGAKSPFDFFTITCPPKEHIGRQARVTGGKRKQLEDNEHGGILKKRHLSNAAEISTLVTGADGLISPITSSMRGGGTNRTPSEPQLKHLMDALYHKVADKWRTIGLYLEIPKGNLAGIGEKCRGDPHSCLVEMLETWLERVQPPATWGAIVEAIEFLGEEQLGKELRQKYTE